MFRLLWQELVLRRNSIIGWGLGLTFFPFVYVGIYPQIAKEIQGMQAILDLQIYKMMGISLGNFEDWMASTVILFVPLLASIYAVINGTATLAGEEEDGRLEMIVALPIPRWQIVVVKAVALGVVLLILHLIVALATVGVFLAIQDQVATSVVAADIVWAVLSGWPLALAIGMISLFLGAFCPNRRTAALIATAVIIVSYFGSNLAGMVSSLEPLRPIFLFTYLDATDSVFIDGPRASDVLILLGVALGAFALALFFFQRRNITVGVWPWQRARTSA
ncbi:MAG: ABC transporter permease subunit [Anaerolineales bacterium]|nr:ABC transporter permease subunit [Anaerolineales bacterium]MCB8953196.1 ABC transporter permease subunit [Ardenticatenales bacterium]